MTLKNTFGETTIPRKPERIVTLGWNAQDVGYALGETPVGMPRVTYGPTPAGVSAWDADRFDAAETTLLDTADGYPFEKIAALRPDVILAPWQDQTMLIGKALGKSPEATKLVAGITDLTRKTAAEHPEFKGRTLTTRVVRHRQLRPPADRPAGRDPHQTGLRELPGLLAKILPALSQAAS